MLFSTIKKYMMLIAVLVIIGAGVQAVFAGYVPLTSGQPDPLRFLDVSASAQSKQGWLALGSSGQNPIGVLDVTGTAIVNQLKVIGKMWTSGKIRIGGTSIPSSTDPLLVVDSQRIRSATLAGTGDRPVCADSTGLFKICSTMIQLQVPQCGSANGSSFATAPTTNLCNYGTASSVSGSGPWSWTCSDNIITKSCSATVTSGIPNGTLYVKKVVINNNGGTKSASDFSIGVLNAFGNNVSGSPQPGVSTGQGTQYSLVQGTYQIVETGSGYTASYSSDCLNGVVNLGAGQTKTCTITNDDTIPHGGVTYLRNASESQYVSSTAQCPGCTHERFVVPPGVTQITIALRGAGGGGGASGQSGYTGTQTYNNAISGSGGGGGGSFAKVQNLSVTPGDTFAVYVGKGGSAGIPGGAPSCTPTQNSTQLGPLPGLYFQGYCNYDTRNGETGQPSFVIGPSSASMPGANSKDWFADIMDWYNLLYNSSTYKSIMAAGGFGGRGTSAGPALGGPGGTLAPNNSPADMTLGPTLSSGLTYSNYTSGTPTKTAGTSGSNGATLMTCNYGTTASGGAAAPGFSGNTTNGYGGRSGYYQKIADTPCTYQVQTPVVGNSGIITISW